MSITLNKEILSELNQCRSNPRRYSSKLMSLLPHFKGLTLCLPNKSPILTKEGGKNVESCIKWLKTVRPSPPLRWSNKLMDVAQLHAQDLADHQISGHFGSDEAGLEERVGRTCQTSGSLAENIDYGNQTGQEIVCSLLVDDGMYARGQRINIMKKDHKFVGAGLAAHNQFGSVCVLIFAEKVLEEGIESASELSSVTEFNDLTLNLEEVKDLRIPGDSSFSYVYQGVKSNSHSDDDFQVFDEVSRTRNLTAEELSQISAFREPSGSRNMMTLIDEEVTLSMSKTEVETDDHVEAPKPLPTSKPPLVPRPKGKNDDFQVSNFDRSELSKDGIVEIKELFDIYDTSGSGFLDSHALKAMKDQLSECSGSEVIQVLCNLDPEEEKISFQNLVELVSEKLSVSRSKQQAGMSEPLKGKKSFDPALYVRAEFNKSDILEIKAAFDMFDVDGTGTISPGDLKKALKTQGFDKKNSTVMKLINEIQVETSEKVNFGEFIDLLASEGSESGSESEIRKLFNIFDVEGSGFIELANLKQIVKELGDTLDEQDIILLFRQSDRDGDGRVSYLDFYNTMKKRKF